MVVSGTSAPAGNVAGLILAGGRGRRMGSIDKPFAPLGGRRMIEHVIGRAGRQVGPLAISAAGDAARFGVFGLPVLADPVGLEAYSGPLAGILAGLEWAAARAAPGAEALAVFPTDTPFFPEDFVERARAALADGAEVAMAASGGRLHPTAAVWSAGLGDRLRRLLVEEGLRRADRVADHFRAARVDYAAQPFDPFFNINTPEDLAAAERLFR
ncbi:molybdenum cofactor guanylyltransferase MobA [Shumkonia mesophila]|uniref:molybdenum cofactor guanylyltransferase MobA n=1 Tax=Shumkonia mesophila TaxID=2838854 RepID=UPI002934F475|nr:molybdenum cofactor guanylyltransferase MobA [Shumkonia mesophila]